ncbi:MAG TPA: hypothetical protein VFE05_07580 [Longimicrobiaceae bacterium]|jgi:hypothetical protein|nr:hypothetical protein [Longimicrobiaceae bacterium]
MMLMTLIPFIIGYVLLIGTVVAVVWLVRSVILMERHQRQIVQVLAAIELGLRERP